MKTLRTHFVSKGLIRRGAKMELFNKKLKFKDGIVDCWIKFV